MKTFIIAELSANHNQDFDLAVKTIEAIASTGADAVKFQTFEPDSFTLDVNNEYFGPRTSGLWEGYRSIDLYTEAAMPYEWQPKLKKIANDLGLVCFSTPFDKGGVDFMEKMNMPIYKIASLEINEINLIEYVASKQKPILISTGAASLEDIELAVETCRKVGNNQITLLKCTSEYPASIDRANLATMVDMREQFSVEVGISDHSLSNIVPVVAVSLGATVVEKHIILDKDLGGVDSAFSLNPKEFTSMVKSVRDAEKVFGVVDYTLKEEDRLRRRSLFACENIKAGEIITEQNIKSVRPGYGMHPKHLKSILGKTVYQDLKKGEPVTKELLIDLDSNEYQ